MDDGYCRISRGTAPPGLTGPVGYGPLAVLGAEGAAPSVEAVIDAVARIAR